MKVLVINGPNINMLGKREPELYGKQDYSSLLQYIENAAKEEGIEVECFQSNHEVAIVDKIQQSCCAFDGIIINPAAYTHTSVAILDALKSVSIPTVEVHLTDTNTREEFRRISYVRQACVQTIMGFGFEGYKKALLFLKSYCK